MVGDKRIEIVFVGKTPFPVSTASSNRILSLGKGLKNAGANVSVYCFGLPKNSHTSQFKKKGEVEGINWHYTTIDKRSTSNKSLRGVSLIIGQVIGYYLLVKNYIDKKPFYFTSQTSFGYIIPLWVLSKITKGRLIFFRSEYPNPVLRNSIFKGFYEKFVYPITIKRFDGMFFMTKKLKCFFDKWKHKNAFSDIAPLTVDIHLFQKKYPSIINEPYIAYSGSLSNKKDGVDVLIKAFAAISNDYPSLKLLIIGAGSGLTELKELASCLLQKRDQVLFTGLIKFKSLPAYTTNANILALARPRSLQAEGGFPSKLGEYLATGNPVVVTDTGEVSDYLENKYSAMVAEPGNVEDFAKKIKWILDNPENAKQIGLKGLEVAKRNFDNKLIGQNILEQLLT